MLPLNSPRWRSLSQAYGDASDVPRMLQALFRDSADVRSEAWSDIWSSLCHQGSVYTASYAAVPHIVEHATSNESARAHCLIFVGAVATSTDAAAIPWELREEYVAALARAEPLVIAAIEAKPSEEHKLVYLLESLAALRGCTLTAQIIEGFADGGFVPRCPAEACGVEVYVSIDGTTMFATLESFATEVGEERIEITPPADAARDGAWSDECVLPLLVELAGRGGHPALATKLALWDGAITCPKCREPFALRTALLDPNEL
jgi:hypothetical protein